MKEMKLRLEQKQKQKQPLFIGASMGSHLPAQLENQPGRATWAHLSEEQHLGVAAVQAQDEADRLEQVLDAGSELLLLHSTGGPRVEHPGLDDELEEVFESLKATETRDEQRLQQPGDATRTLCSPPSGSQPRL